MADLTELEDHLAASACVLVADIREDVAAAHRSVRAMSKLELEQLCCVLAAMVDASVPWSQIAWWRTLRAVS